jgi:hypothetical protein
MLVFIVFHRIPRDDYSGNRKPLVIVCWRMDGARAHVAAGRRGVGGVVACALATAATGRAEGTEMPILAHRKGAEGGKLVHWLISVSIYVAQVELKTMTMFDEQRVAYKFMGKLERVLVKIEDKALPVSEALRRAQAAMMHKARLLFIVPKFNCEDPGNVHK